MFLLDSLCGKRGKKTNSFCGSSAVLSFLSNPLFYLQGISSPSFGSSLTTDVAPALAPEGVAEHPAPSYSNMEEID